MSTETESHAPIDALTVAFHSVTPAAIPTVIDCILTSAKLDPSLLFHSLIDDFPEAEKVPLENAESRGRIGSNRSWFLSSYFRALCYLLKRMDASHATLELFIVRCYVPLVTNLYTYEKVLLNEVVNWLVDLLAETDTWDVVEGTLVYFLLQSVVVNAGLQSDDALILCCRCSTTFFQDSEAMLRQCMFVPSLPLSCNVLASIVEAALAVQAKYEKNVPSGFVQTLQFLGKLLFDLWNVTVKMILHTPERLNALQYLLPSIFEVFIQHESFRIYITGQNQEISRSSFFVELWACCKLLFSLGYTDQKDAYSILSLYFSFFPYAGECADGDVGNGFNLMRDDEFWNRIRNGLVDKEGLVRKQCLYVLKTVLQTSRTDKQGSSVSNNVLGRKGPICSAVGKRNLWAEKEAKSLGVGKKYNINHISDGKCRWEAFLILYEMLEEYGTHLVEAAWDSQITWLLHLSSACNGYLQGDKDVCESQMETLDRLYVWVGVLWKRGLSHENPLVRCLIMQSFLNIEWQNVGSFVCLVPESFIFGTLLQALDDPVHHKDFGLGGVYQSNTIDYVSNFFYQYSSHLSARAGIAFVKKFASVVNHHSFGRHGLMCFSRCISAAASGVQACISEVGECFGDAEHGDKHETLTIEWFPPHNLIEFIDDLRFLVESSKQHFNSTYRLIVCSNIMEAVASLLCPCCISSEMILHLISAIPREFTDDGGSLRIQVQEWLLGRSNVPCSSKCGAQLRILLSLNDFMEDFIFCRDMITYFDIYDDGDLESWSCRAKQWARLLFLVADKQQDFITLLSFIMEYATKLRGEDVTWIRLKYLILILCLVEELQIKLRTTDILDNHETKFGSVHMLDQLGPADIVVVLMKFANSFHSILDHLVPFANASCSIFWSNSTLGDTCLPSSVTGKLGGRTERRISPSVVTAVLGAITSMKSVAFVAAWCVQINRDMSFDSAFCFLWKFFWKTILLPVGRSETGAEIHLAAYEALASVLKALASACTFPLLNHSTMVLGHSERESLLGDMVFTFLRGINNLIALDTLARSRRAVLLNWKWLCLESLLSLSQYAVENPVNLQYNFISTDSLKMVFTDLVESLENAGEISTLPMLRSVRLIIGLLAARRLQSVFLWDIMDAGMVWHLFRSAWILQSSCNKRRVHSIAALLSSVMHVSLFNDDSMHVVRDEPGPLKWFVGKILEQGTKSPRTIRLAALHLTGLLFLNPTKIKYYLEELKLLSLHGSSAFDEDFEAEISENPETKMEISLLTRTPDDEICTAFVNTELYARVSVAVLFHKLAGTENMSGSESQHENELAASESGKLFLLYLLDSTIHDVDLAKELYKKHSGVHRRKIRVWQMICILSPFVGEDIVHSVVERLNICLCRNNLSSVRQYIEIFCIQLHLKFPSLVNKNLVPLLQDFDMRQQSLASYVFIAANVILHAPAAIQLKHLNELLPHVIPLLTSHHHTLRGFTQLLVYQVFSKLLPVLDDANSSMSLEKICFDQLGLYLAKNPDCMRLRASMMKYLDEFDPNELITPVGIFKTHIKDVEFECVPTPLLEQVTSFLDGVRDNLRSCMANDAVTIRNESLVPRRDYRSLDTEECLVSRFEKLDFQRKITSHRRCDGESTFVEMEREDFILEQSWQLRNATMGNIRESRQDFMVVASLLDRIPNLAGLARTCEIFKAGALVIADSSLLDDKQFQLISVTAEKWMPILEVPPDCLKLFLNKKKSEGCTLLGLEQTTNSIPLHQYSFPRKTVLVLGREKDGIPADVLHALDACIEIPQLGMVRSLNVHVSASITLWEYTKQHRFK